MKTALQIITITALMCAPEVVGLGILATRSCLADEIVLRDGRRVPWKSVADDGDSYIVEMKDGKKLTFKKSEVERFAMGDSTADTKPLTGASFTLDPKRSVTTDLIPKAKTEATGGAWKPGVRAIVNPGENPGRTTLSFDHELPEEYDLSLVVERMSGTGGFEIGIVQGDATAAFHFDAFNCAASMFGTIGGQFAAKTEGQVFRPGKARAVRIAVRRDALLVQLDGKDFWKSRLDWKTVSLHGDIPAPEKKRPFVVGYGGGWKIAMFTVSVAK